MSEAWEKLKPKDKFSVIKAYHVSEADYVVLNMLYQPIVGTDAIGFFNLLLIEEKINGAKRLQPHSVLLNQLDMGIPHFFDARKKLEAVGLLKSFAKPLEDGMHFIYEIQPVMPPVKFLHDDILSLLLIDKLGFEKVEELSLYFHYDRKDMADYTEVTQSFMDVFQFDSARLVSKEEELFKVKENVTKPTEVGPIKEITQTFDWQFFISLTESLHIDNKQLQTELKRTIELFHQLYGINELEMFDYVKQSIDYVTNRVAEKDFKQLIYKGYHSRKKQEVTSKEVDGSNQEFFTETDRSQLRMNTLRLTGFSDDEIQVITSCDRIAPLLFLKAIKTQKGGFVSTNERFTIETLKKQSSLPDSVINMLTHYMLVVQDFASLNQNMMMSIANDWAQKKIFSPEEALSQVKKLQEAKQAPKKKANNYKGSQRKETLPDWAKEDVVRKETPLSKEEDELLKARIERLTKKKEGDN